MLNISYYCGKCVLLFVVCDTAISQNSLSLLTNTYEVNPYMKWSMTKLFCNNNFLPERAEFITPTFTSFQYDIGI